MKTGDTPLSSLSGLWKQTALMGAIRTTMCSMSHCLHVTSLPAIAGINWTTLNKSVIWLETNMKSAYLSIKLLAFGAQRLLNFSDQNIKMTTHQIFGTHSDSRCSSLLFSDSRYHSSTGFCSSCIQNIGCSGRCSSLGSPSPCSPPQPVEQFGRRTKLNIHKQ